MFRPKLLDTLKDYTWDQFLRDSMAGLVVACVALPLAIAFAIASGVTPERGLYTAIIAGFIISVLGGSRVQIGGPTGAFVVIVYGIIQLHGFHGLLLATIMAGGILILFGIARLGSIIKFIPHSVIVGFTLGIALLILLGQVGDFLGLGIKNLPADAFDKVQVLWGHLERTNPAAVLIALGTLLCIAVTGRFAPRIPGPLFAILLASVTVWFFHLPVETIGSRFGSIPVHLPAPIFPRFDLKTMRTLLNPAFTIAMLGAIESLLSAVVSDGMINGRNRSNTELIAQGIANVAAPLFGGLPATGAIARTATNVQSGGRTPVAGMLHAVTLLLFLLFFSHWVLFIPLACLAGVLAAVAYHMSEWRPALSLLKLSRGSALVMLVTFGLTVFVDLTTAIEVGLIIATFVFIRNMSRQTQVQLDRSFVEEEENEGDYSDSERYRLSMPKGALMYTITGPLFFGAVYKFKEALAEISHPPRVMLLQMGQVPVIDSTGVHALSEAIASLKRSGTQFILCGLQAHLREQLDRGGLTAQIGAEYFCPNLQAGLLRAKELCRNKP